MQVGSKNAAFFMGGCTKVVTKSAQSSFVHELSLAARELEERYKNKQVLCHTPATVAFASLTFHIKMPR